MTLIFCHLDHTHVCLAGRVCHAWHRASICDTVWRSLCRRQDWPVKPREPALEHFQAKYLHSCYDCLRPCDHTTFQFGKLVLRSVGW